jgi:hypothetical protein
MVPPVENNAAMQQAIEQNCQTAIQALTGSAGLDVNAVMKYAIEQDCKTAIQALIGSAGLDFNAAIVYAFEQDCKTAIQALIESASLNVNAAMVYAFEQDCKTEIQDLIESARLNVNAAMEYADDKYSQSTYWENTIQALKASDRASLATVLAGFRHLGTPSFLPSPRGHGKKLCINQKLLQNTYKTNKVSVFFGYKITKKKVKYEIRISYGLFPDIVLRVS